MSVYDATAAMPPTPPPASGTSSPSPSWQARADRVARLLVLPLLAVSTVLAVSGESDSWSRFDYGLIVVGVAALWAAALIRYPVTGVSARTRLAVFCVHILLAAVLVWIDPWYGVFAITGYFLADELGPRRRVIGFAATAAVLAGSQTGSYPHGWTSHTFAYAIMVCFNLFVVVCSVSLTNRVMEQNLERGQIIDKLAEANRRLEASMVENAGLHAQLLVQAREAGIIDERQRLAGEIHDTLAQGLTGIITQLQAARQARHDPDEWSRHLDLADSLARTNLTEARRSVRALRPGQLEDTSLPDALRTLTQGWSERAMIQADVEITGTPTRADSDVEATLFRVAQEALSNVAKHAQATKTHLTLSYLDDTLLLDIADNGRGMQPTTAIDSRDTGGGTGGYGLAGMRRRLERLAGHLNVESAAGYGTTVNATIRLHTAAPQTVR